MGRKLTNPVGQLYFNYNILKNESVCKIEGCRRPILKGRHSNNLETHIRSNHSKEYKVLQDMKNEDIPKQKRPIDDSIVELSSSKVINYMYYFLNILMELIEDSMCYTLIPTLT